MSCFFLNEFYRILQYSPHRSNRVRNLNMTTCNTVRKVNDTVLNYQISMGYLGKWLFTNSSYTQPSCLQVKYLSGCTTDTIEKALGFYRCGGLSGKNSWKKPRTMELENMKARPPKMYPEAGKRKRFERQIQVIKWEPKYRWIRQAHLTQSSQHYDRMYFLQGELILVILQQFCKWTLSLLSW